MISLRWARRLRRAQTYLLLAGLSPFLAEHPKVKEGNAQMEAGDVATALERYAEAEAELGRRPEIEYDRGNALFRAGRLPEARDAYARALDGATGSLSVHGLYNTGNALAAMGDAAGAIAAYRRALAADPTNEDARYNLEVMLRRERERSVGPRPLPSPDARGERGGSEGVRSYSEDGGNPLANAERDEGAPDGGMSEGPGGVPRPEPRDGSSDGGGGSRAEAHDQQGVAGRGRRLPEVSRQEAERLLDGIRARERRMPVAPARRQKARREDVEKDW